MKYVMFVSPEYQNKLQRFDLQHFKAVQQSARKLKHIFYFFDGGMSNKVKQSDVYLNTVTKIIKGKRGYDHNPHEKWHLEKKGKKTETERGIIIKKASSKKKKKRIGFRRSSLCFFLFFLLFFFSSSYFNLSYYCLQHVFI